MSVVENKNLSASQEDYLEVIFNLSVENNVARSKDISESLGVSKSSVTGALRVLKQKGLVNYKPYGFVTLTESGRVIAAAIARKHDILKSFFIDVLGVDTETAQQAACKAEHAMSPALIRRFLSFIEFVGQSDKNGFDLAKEFRDFYENKR